MNKDILGGWCNQGEWHGSIISPAQRVLELCWV